MCEIFNFLINNEGLFYLWFSDSQYSHTEIKQEAVQVLYRHTRIKQEVERFVDKYSMSTMEPGVQSGSKKTTWAQWDKTDHSTVLLESHQS